jgi:predicted nucleotidyltransferase
MRHPPSITELIDPVLKLEPVAVYHFGSSATGPERLRPDSDIDLAFLAARSCDPYRVFLTAQEVARIAGREVDLIDLRQVGSVVAAQVVGHGRRVFTAPGCGQLADEFELLTLAGYARLNEERSEVLATELAR